MAQIGKPLREGEILVPREFPPPKEAPRQPKEPAERPAKSPSRRKKVPA